MSINFEVTISAAIELNKFSDKLPIGSVLLK